MADKTYRIVRLEASNVRRLTAVSITPDGNLVEISGKNGAGKSSTLDAIFWALAGKPKEQKTPMPIRRGQETALIKLDLGSLKITRKFANREEGGYTTSLIVETEEGARFQKPQDVLDTLIGELAFDPLEFTRMKPPDQLEVLKRFVPGYDFADAELRRKEAFDTRTDVSRRLKDLKSQAAGIAVPEDTPDVEIDVSALAGDIQAIGEHNAQIEAMKAARARTGENAVRFRKDADEYEQQGKDYRRLAIEADSKAASLRSQAKEEDDKLAKAGDLPAPRDPSDLRAQIEGAKSINTNVRDKTRRTGLLAEVETTEKEVSDLTTTIETIDIEKAKAISGAKIPVAGIGFADDYITLDGFPFQQASQAEQLKASIGIAVASNPKLRVLIVREGALLDDDSMMAVAEIADAMNVQVFVETVASTRPNAIIIEDGHVREQLQAAE